MAVPAAVLAAAGAAALVYYTGFRETRRSKRRPHVADAEDEQQQGSPKRVKRTSGLPGYPRIPGLQQLSRLFAERLPERPPRSCIEAAYMMASSIRIVCRETVFKWPLGDLFFGLAFVWRRKKQSHVSRIYAEDEGSVQLTLSAERAPELRLLKRLVSLCFCFARRTYNDLLKDFGYKREDVLIFEPQAKLLAPAFTVIVDHQCEWILVLLRGTHSHKDRFTCATCVGVPFHHAVLAEEWEGGEEGEEEAEEEDGPESGVCMVCGVKRRHHKSAGAEVALEGRTRPLCPTTSSQSQEGLDDLLADGSSSCQEASMGRCRGRTTEPSRPAVKQIVLGYAHCGMVAAARALAQRITGLLQETLRKHPGYVVKVVGHSLGGATSALLTFILREKEGLEDTTCIAFGPAAAMTWDLAESAQCCVTSFINGADFVPTFSGSSVDDLRKEVSRSAWANDLHEQLRKMRALRIILQTVGALRRQLAVIRASTVAMSTKASRQLYARLATATRARGMIMALRSMPRKGFLCFPAGRMSAGSLAAAGAGEPPENRLLKLIGTRRPVLRFFQRACSALPLLSLPAVSRSPCALCCPPALPGLPGAASSQAPPTAFCGRCRVRSSLPLLGFRRQQARPSTPPPSVPRLSLQQEAGLLEGPGPAAAAAAMSGTGASGYTAEEMERWAHPLRAVDTEGYMRMRRDEPSDALSIGATRPEQVVSADLRATEGLHRVSSGHAMAESASPEGVFRRRLGDSRDAESPLRRRSEAAGTSYSSGRSEDSDSDSDSDTSSDEGDEEEEPQDDAALGLAALLEAMAEGEEEAEGAGPSLPSRADGNGEGSLVPGESVSPRESRAQRPSWAEMEQELGEVGVGELTAEEESVMEVIIEEEEKALEEVLREEREEASRGFGELEGGEDVEEGLVLGERTDSGASGGLGDAVLEGVPLLGAAAGEAGEDAERSDGSDDEEDEEIRDPRRWYPCGRIVHMVWNTWESSEDGDEEDEPGSALRTRPKRCNSCQEAGAMCGQVPGASELCSNQGCGAGPVSSKTQKWRVGMFEVDRRLYGKIKLSGNMVSDHLMANYVKSFQALLEDADEVRTWPERSVSSPQLTGLRKELSFGMTCA